jgi:hypothetical protein
MPAFIHIAPALPDAMLLLHAVSVQQLAVEAAARL